jgi:hypothetical protein
LTAKAAATPTVAEISGATSFYFDSINSTAWIKDGVLHTDDTLVDGLEADIAMKRVKVKTFAEGIAEVEAQFAQ